MLGQHKYFECYLHQLDTLANLKVSQLMEYHCNRFVRTYPGKTGKSAMAMDQYMEIRIRDLSLMASSRTLEGMCHKGSYVGVTVRCKRAAQSIFGYGQMLERTVFRSSSGSKNNQTPEKMLMYEVFSLLLCDIRNVSARSVTVDTVRLLKDKIETKLDMPNIQ